MWGHFLKNRRAQLLGVYRRFMNKCDKPGITHSKHKSWKIKKTANLHQQNDLLKTTRSKRLASKAGSVEGQPGSLGGLSFCSSAWAKRCSKGFLFEKHESQKWHPKPTLHNSSALGPSKTHIRICPVRGGWKGDWWRPEPVPQVPRRATTWREEAKQPRRGARPNREYNKSTRKMVWFRRLLEPKWQHSCSTKLTHELSNVFTYVIFCCTAMLLSRLEVANIPSRDPSRDLTWEYSPPVLLALTHTSHAAS